MAQARSIVLNEYLFRPQFMMKGMQTPDTPVADHYMGSALSLENVSAGTQMSCHFVIEEEAKIHNIAHHHAKSESFA